MLHHCVILELAKSERIAFGNVASSGITDRRCIWHEIPAFAGMTNIGMRN